jgi:hypothetical protein
MYRDADEVESFGAESPVQDQVPRSGRVELKAVAEIFFGSRVLCRHNGPAFRSSRSDVVADAAW